MPNDIEAKVLRPSVDLPQAAETIVEQITQRLQGRVEAAYLFGSLAEGRATRDSDIDLLLVAQTDKPFLERWRDFSDILQGEYAIDLLVYTPAEFKRLTSNPTVGFWQSFVTANRRLV
jgi:predicted nucleotidyltransferase